MTINRAAVFLAALIMTGFSLAGCSASGQAESGEPPRELGMEPPSWMTEQDVRDIRKWLVEWGQELGIEEEPPPMVRWVRYNEWLDVYAACYEDLGVTPIVDYVRMEIDADLPDGQFQEKQRLYWLCTAMYPLVYPREMVHSEKTQHVVYDYFVDELVPCLAQQGYMVPDVPTFEVYSERYLANDQWTPYVASDVLGWGVENHIDIEDYCPQWPTDGRLDYLYEED